MPKLVDLKAHGLKDQAYENEQLAQHFEMAAERARAGDFKSVCWIAWGRDESAHFGWLKYGSMVPLIGCVATVLRDMGDAPHTCLHPLDPEEPA
jgi:hypothetical protein